MKLILASGSQNRRQALNLAKIPFISVPSNINEAEIKDPDIRSRVIKVARTKVLKVAEKKKGVIYGADGVNLCQGKVLEKPKSLAQAYQMLKTQSGKLCSFLTGYYILNTKTGKTYRGTAETFYKFRQLTDSEIKEYIHSSPVLTWAAAFSPANSMALRFVKYVKGSYSNFNYSLPFDKVIPILQKEGIVEKI